MFTHETKHWHNDLVNSDINHKHFGFIAHICYIYWYIFMIAAEEEHVCDIQISTKPFSICIQRIDVIWTRSKTKQKKKKRRDLV